MADSILFEDIFTITDMDKGGKKFDKVSRIEARSEQYDMEVTLDVNTEIYPLHIQDKLTLALARTLSLDGTPDEPTFDQSGRRSLMDKFEYVMYGKLYKYSDDESSKGARVEIFVSFGGLQMRLSGEGSHLTDFNLDQHLYILLRKLA
eukprot:TRINITY_DN1170_c0_g1_i6.p2 TRINITY_DN1170_c0_g1~~TRINITY_DN1170_c0_g1_i6.p2  ORF type:complete len:148 (+),score=32.35 TRINITY_DN1170_c0_g1_i6:117-560(+)